MRYTIGIDLGGTNIAAGLVDEQLNIVARKSIKTNAPRSAQAICEDMAELCRGFTRQLNISMQDIGWIGVGSPGIIMNGEIKYASNLALSNAPVVQLVSDMTGRPVYLQNDANAAAYGEYLSEGQNSRSMLLMTIGTGIGAGLILNGRIYSGFNGAAPEPGHMTLRQGGRCCSCQKTGCFETYGSAKGLVQSIREAMDEHPESMLWTLYNKNPGKIHAPNAFVAQQAGDAAATAVVEQYLDDLAIGISNLINLLQPELFCIGGGVSRQGDSLLLPLRERVEKLTFSGADGIRTRLTLAKLGNDAGIIGAAMLGSMP